MTRCPKISEAAIKGEKFAKQSKRIDAYLNQFKDSFQIMESIENKWTNGFIMITQVKIICKIFSQKVRRVLYRRIYNGKNRNLNIDLW